MKLALIPPTLNLGQFNSTGIHLLLAQHLKADAPLHKQYFNYYYHRSLQGDFLILDNGAHEKRFTGIKELLSIGASVQADEIVIPDWPNAASGTYVEFLETVKWLNSVEGQADYESCGAPRLMVVPQGVNIPELLDVAAAMHRVICGETWIKPSHFTFGVPLIYDRGRGELIRIVDSLASMAERSGMQIHLLGWSRFMETPIEVSRQYPGVRSIDTAKPFVYARSGIQFPSTTTKLDNIPSYPGRTDDYFIRKLTQEEAYIGTCNANILKSLLFDATLPELSEPSYGVPEDHRGWWDGSHSPRLSDTARDEEGETSPE